MRRYFLLIAFLTLISPLLLIAQDNEADNPRSVNTNDISSKELRKQALNIFLDCQWCDHTYIKKTIPYVNYVRNKDEADVHVFVRRQVNGGGGGDYTIDFIGHGDFDGINEKLKFISPIDETPDETRRARSGMIAMGLMQYVAQTPVGRNIKIEFEDKDVPERVLSPTIEDDPWNSWMFRIRANGSFGDDANYRNTSLSTSLSSDRITPELKIEVDGDYSISNRIYKELASETKHRDWKFRTLVVKSISDNWSIGGRAGISGSIKNNYDYSFSAGPAIEYNIFPYEESFKHQIRFQYGVSAVFNNYIDTTIFLKTEEQVFSHYLSVAGGVNQEWGNGHLYITYSNFLHDFELNKLSIGGRIDYRIYKGLSVNFKTNASIVHDQINLRLEGATTEDILTQQYALKSGYKYSFTAGLTYSFGSIYNNVVNTRFGN